LTPTKELFRFRFQKSVPNFVKIATARAQTDRQTDTQMTQVNLSHAMLLQCDR